jgi:hypothetical protein
MYFVNKGVEGRNYFQSEGACPVYGNTRILDRAGRKVKKAKGHPCIDSEALYRPYGP